MKKQSIFTRIILPSLLTLLLLPTLFCFIFQYAAKEYAYREANRELDTLQKSIIPIIDASFSRSLDKTPQEQAKAFLLHVGTTIGKTSGHAKLLIFASEMQMVYPRNPDNRLAVSSVSEACSEYILSKTNKSISGETVEITTDDGEIVLANFYQVPRKIRQVKYVVTYCPTTGISQWTKTASFWGLVVAFVFAVIVFIVLWFSVLSITRPLRQLGQKAKQIGAGIFIDIEPSFALRELEDLRHSMNQMSSKLRHSEEMQRNFFQNVSHDLRTPLMSITGYAQGIEQGVFPNTEAAAHTILEESIRLTELVNSLLTLSRLEVVTSKELSEINIADAIGECLERMNGLAMKNNIVFSVKQFEHSIVVQAEYTMLAQILENLISNAIRYAHATVTIEVVQSDDLIAISVIDDGDGISQQDMPHIFERCYKGKGGNFGIGLTIAQFAANYMNGELFAANHPNGGAVFTLKLKS